MHFRTHRRPRHRPAREGAWWKELTRYQWFVFIVASLGWLFDTMDQQLFNLARDLGGPQLAAHRRPATRRSPARSTSTRATRPRSSCIGWAIGGIFFGILGDKIGRAKTMMLTVLCYSAFTGLSALSTGVWDFAFYRFLTGLGVGGQFAVGVSWWPRSCRTAPGRWRWARSRRSRPSATCWRRSSASCWASSRSRARSPAPGGSCS